MIDPAQSTSYALWAALLAILLGVIGEKLHARRTKRIASLVFGPGGRARKWTALAPCLRILSLGVLAWGLVTLLSFHAMSRSREKPGNINRHLLIMLDVSPSMHLKDAGDGSLSRNERATAVVKSVLDRITADDVRYSTAGFYTEARMLVKECQDRELILHMIGNVPFHITYEPGKTDLLKSLNQGGEFAKDWPRKSTTLLVLSDGDSIPPSGLKPLPSSINSLIIAGVGDASRGTFIDGHLSRQDTANLSQLARRLGGTYIDCNAKNIPDTALKSLIGTTTGQTKWRIDRRLATLVAIALSSSFLCLLPILLDYFGSAWRPRPKPSTIHT
jgi:Ca-activated chloride channel family protein